MGLRIRKDGERSVKFRSDKDAPSLFGQSGISGVSGIAGISSVESIYVIRLDDFSVSPATATRIVKRYAHYHEVGMGKIVLRCQAWRDTLCTGTVKITAGGLIASGIVNSIDIAIPTELEIILDISAAGWVVGDSKEIIIELDISTTHNSGDAKHVYMANPELTVDFTEAITLDGDLTVGNDLFVVGDNIHINYGNALAGLPIITFHHPAGGSDTLRFSNVLGDVGLHASVDFTADGDLNSKGNVFVNKKGPDGDAFLYFFEGTDTGKFLKWDNVADQFEFNGSVEIQGNIGIFSDVFLNPDGPDGDFFLNFFDGGLATGSWLKWDDANSRFRFNKPLYDERFYITTTDTVTGNARGISHLTAGSDDFLFPNTSYFIFHYGLSFVNFDDGAGSANSNLAMSSFFGLEFFTGGLTRMRINKNGEVGIGKRATHAGTFKLDVAGNVGVEGNVYINSAGPDGDSFLYFWETTATGASLKWNNTVTGFVLSHTLDMSFAKITSVSDPTVNQDAATKAYVDAHNASATAYRISNINVTSTAATFGNGTQLLSFLLLAGTWLIHYEIDFHSTNIADGLHGCRFWLEDGTVVVEFSSTRQLGHNLAGIATNFNVSQVLILTLTSTTTITLEGAKTNSSLLQVGGTSANSTNLRTNMVAVKLQP